MTRDELAAAKKALYDHYIEAADLTYALNNSKYKVGDIVDDGMGAIRIGQIDSFLKLDGEPIAVYIGYECDARGKRKQGAKKRKIHSDTVS